MQLPNITTFSVYRSLKKAKTFDISGSYMPKATILRLGHNSSYSNSALQNIKMNNLTTPKLTTLSYLCCYLTGLTNFEAVGLDTSKVTMMDYSFYYCSKLPKLDLSEWNFEQITNMNYAFYYCQSLEELKLPEITTANKQIDYLFCDCNKLTNLDSVTFDLTTTTSARSLFNRCYELSDVHFNAVDAPNLTNMYYMFNGC